MKNIGKVARNSLIVVIALLAVGVAFVTLQIHRGAEASFEYRLKWLANAGFVGDLYADTYGYYVNEGLHVKVAQGGPDRDALTALLRPNSDTWFAVASADQVIQAIYRDRQNGSDLRVIAQVYAANPVQWIYRADGGTISSPAQLKGKRIGVAIGDNDETIMKAYLKKNGIKDNEVTFVGVQFDFGPFLNRSVDLYPVYTNTQGVELRKQLEGAGEKAAFFDPSMGPKGIRFVANSIVTTSRIIQDNPGVVRHFLQATMRGWNDATLPENRERATRAVILAAGETSNPDIIALQIGDTALLVRPREPGAKIGRIDQEAWKQTEDTMYAEGLLKTPRGEQPPKLGVEAYLDSDYLPK